MRIHFCPNTVRNDQVMIAKDIILSMEKDNIVCTLSKDDSMAIFSDLKRVGEIKDCDIVASLGGDGAVLRAAQIAIKHNKTLLGINAGRLGYLCAIDAKTIKEIVTDDNLPNKPNA